MAINNEEQRKAVSGIVTPNAAKDADWRRQVAGVYSFGDDESPPGTGNPQGPVYNPVQPAVLSPSFAPLHIPLIALGG